MIRPQIHPCRQCQTPIDATRRATLAGHASRPVLLDLQCDACGRRALYPTV